MDEIREVIDKIKEEMRKFTKHDKLRYEEWIGFGHHLDIFNGSMSGRCGVLNGLLVVRSLKSGDSKTLFLDDGIGKAVQDAIAFLVGQ